MCRIYFQWNTIFRSEYSFLIYTEKRKEGKNWIQTVILATQNSMNQKNVCEPIRILHNTFEYYVIQQHNTTTNNMQAFLVVIQKTFLTRIYSLHLNILCFFFTLLVFWAQIKWHDFLRAGAFAPDAPPSATRLRIFPCNNKNSF